MASKRTHGWNDDERENDGNDEQRRHDDDVCDDVGQKNRHPRSEARIHQKYEGYVSKKDVSKESKIALFNWGLKKIFSTSIDKNYPWFFSFNE